MQFYEDKFIFCKNKMPVFKNTPWMIKKTIYMILDVYICFQGKKSFDSINMTVLNCDMKRSVASLRVKKYENSKSAG